MENIKSPALPSWEIWIVHLLQQNLEIKRRMIGSMFPGKLIFENSEYRTTKVNEFVNLICLNHNVLEEKKNRKSQNNFEKSREVPLIDKISNQFMEELRILSDLERFISQR